VYPVDHAQSDPSAASLMNARRSALTWSICVVHMPRDALVNFQLGSLDDFGGQSASANLRVI
jgi:hypothetical protein